MPSKLGIYSGLVLAAAMAASAAATTTSPRFREGSQLFSRAACSEGAQRICYGADGGTSQELDPDDVAYVAAYLRFVGQENSGLEAMWTMPADSTCAEWGLPVDGAGTVLALAKHVDPDVTTSVLYEDLANTIDGGEDGENAETALLGCAANGGQMGVVFDASNPAYNTDEYKATSAQPGGIVIKLVRAPMS